MEPRIELSRIKLVVSRDRDAEILQTLHKIGVVQAVVETGRSLQLYRPRGPWAREEGLEEDPVHTFRFFVESALARSVLESLVEALDLDLPGAGSAWASSVTLAARGPGLRPNALNLPAVGSRFLANDLECITCITQKGEGNPVARVALTTGTGVPTLGLGTGTGLRNRLGVWRILVPAEKDVACVVVDRRESAHVFDLMVHAGQLDRPGKGYIYRTPVDFGHLNTQYRVGSQGMAASIEQIVGALDELKGSTEWRRKDLGSGAARKQLPVLNDLVEMDVSCAEGWAEPLTEAALAAGAPGATLRRERRLDLDRTDGKVAREGVVMNLSPAKVDAMIEVLVGVGLLGPEADGDIQLTSVPQACTFLG